MAEEEEEEKDKHGSIVQTELSFYPFGAFII